jgi:hypothetical protein
VFRQHIKQRNSSKEAVMVKAIIIWNSHPY